MLLLSTEQFLLIFDLTYCHLQLFVNLTSVILPYFLSLETIIDFKHKRVKKQVKISKYNLLFSPIHYSNLEVSLDRKSTRLNSSHVSISYAVFCLKKKKNIKKKTLIDV